jgi:hypothetical protein
MSSELVENGRMFWREFLSLWGFSVAVVALYLSLLHIPADGLASILFIPLRSHSALLLLIALIAQKSIEFAIYVGVGLWAARRIGLGAPVLEAWLCGGPVVSRVRALLVPTIVIVLVVVACGELADSRVLNPNRKYQGAEFNELLKSPWGVSFNKQIQDPALARAERITPITLGVVDVASAVGGSLEFRLFGVSVVAYLLTLTFRKRGAIASRRICWASVLFVTLVLAAHHALVEHVRTLADSAMYEMFGLRFWPDPYWLIALRSGVGMVPGGAALGWLYVRYGIESSIAASFLASVTAYSMMTWWFVRFM